MSKQSRHFATSPSTDEATAIQLQRWRTIGLTDEGCARRERWCRGVADGGAKLLPAVEAGAAFPSPSTQLPARLPARPSAHRPPPLISEFPDFDIYYSVCHVFAHPGLISPQTGRLRSPGHRPELLNFLPFPEKNKAEIFRKVILRPSVGRLPPPSCSRRGWPCADGGRPDRVRAGIAFCSSSKCVAPRPRSVGGPTPESGKNFFSNSRDGARGVNRKRLRLPSSTAHSFWPRMNYT